MKDMQPEVYDKAADRILDRGWVQGHGVLDGKFCMGAAVQQEASIVHGQEQDPWNDAYAVVEPYFIFLTKCLYPEQPTYSGIGAHYIICWNDHQGRTQGEVVEALLNAGKALREQQQADVRED